jgi:hypothetical protein
MDLPMGSNKIEFGDYQLNLKLIILKVFINTIT